MRFLPLFADLSSSLVAVVGSGPAAQNKLRLLRSAGANVRWFTGGADVSTELMLFSHPPGRVEVSSADPLQADLSAFVAVIAAGGAALDEAIAARARAANTLVNIVDRPEISSFVVPAIIDRGEVVVAIGTGGASPVLARRLRERIEALLPARIGDLAALLGRYRSHFSSKRHASRSLRRFWERVIDGPIGAAALAGRWRDAENALKSAVEDAQSPEEKSGVVYLVGAVPGDPDMLTLRALQALQDADVVFHDEDVSQEILDRSRRDAERVLVGKHHGEPGVARDQVNRRLVEAARHGHQVVRLKGGDAFVLGHDGEELGHLRDAGVPAIVIPGVAAAPGGTAATGPHTGTFAEAAA